MMVEFGFAASMLLLCVLVAAKIVADSAWSAFCVVRWYCKRKDKQNSNADTPPIVATEA